MTQTAYGAEANHGKLLMNLVHHVTAVTAGRTTMELNVRQRLVIQRLGQVGEAAMASVGSALGFSPSTMTGLVDRLEEQSYVRRRPHPTDRRTTQLSLTKKGVAVFAQEVEFYRSIMDQILASLSDVERCAVLTGLENVSLPPEEAAAA